MGARVGATGFALEAGIAGIIDFDGAGITEGTLFVGAGSTGGVGAGSAGVIGEAGSVLVADGRKAGVFLAFGLMFLGTIFGGTTLLLATLGTRWIGS